MPDHLKSHPTGTRLSVPGQPQVNPLLILSQTCEALLEPLRQIAANTAPKERHIYAIAHASTARWFTYCIACSVDQERYVHPCAVAATDAEVPPSAFSTE